MAQGHAHAGYLEKQSRLHHLAAHRKIVATVLFIFAVVCTPRATWWPYAVYLAVLGVVAVAGSIPLWFVVRRMVIEIPFVIFAVLLPIFARGPRIDVLGMSLSESGLIAGATILLKGTIGVIAAIELAATTRPTELVSGLQRLRVPSIIVEILSFMLRYAAVISDDVHRMRIAREARCFAPRHLGHVRAVATSAGTLFVRTYERGERVHLAMLARGYSGTLPVYESAETPTSARREWLMTLAVPATAIVTVSVCWLIR